MSDAWLQSSSVKLSCETACLLHVEQKEEGAVAAVKKGMALLDRQLTKNTYLVGHTATLADIVGVCNLYHGYTKVRSCRGLQIYCQAALDVRAWCSRKSEL